MNKIFLIIDKSQAYNNFQKLKKIKELGKTAENVQKISYLNEAAGSSLFGDVATYYIHIDNSTQYKRIITDLDKMSVDDLKETFSEGLIITCNLNRTQTKKLEAYFKKNKLSMIIPSTDKDATISEKLLSELSLNKTVVDFILAYVGEDYEPILALVESISEVPRNKQKFITENDIMIRFPQDKGTLPAWDVEKYIMLGDTNQAIATARRSASTLLWLSLLKNKMVVYYRVANLLQSNPRLKDDEIIKILKLPPRGFYFTKNNVKKFSPEIFEKAVHLIITTEAEIKGGKSSPNTANSELLVIELCRLFNK